MINVHSYHTVSQEIRWITFVNDEYIPPAQLLMCTPSASPTKPSPKKGKGGRKRKLSENESPSSPQPATLKKKKKKTALKTAIFDIDDDKAAEPPPQSITVHLHLKCYERNRSALRRLDFTTDKRVDREAQRTSKKMRSE